MLGEDPGRSAFPLATGGRKLFNYFQTFAHVILSKQEESITRTGSIDVRVGQSGKVIRVTDTLADVMGVRLKHGQIGSYIARLMDGLFTPQTTSIPKDILLLTSYEKFKELKVPSFRFFQVSQAALHHTRIPGHIDWLVRTAVLDTGALGPAVS
ncbi:hypothetical protein RRG08_066568 [Elysia crispata]|uniref:Uncharacterized protein n=1 Tax=Elysia crispata TaxID=231223 RepID=A0AAE0XPM4_9GAST|nr:hypothetical protein RRG08_066568 [Elysia crispata]